MLAIDLGFVTTPRVVHVCALIILSPLFIITSNEPIIDLATYRYSTDNMLYITWAIYICAK